MWHGKYCMIIFYRQQFLHTCFYPLLFFTVATLRTMAVAATMIHILHSATVTIGATICMITKTGSAATFYTTEHCMTAGAVICFQFGICCSNCCRVARHGCTSLFAAIALAVIELIERINDTATSMCLQMQIDHGSRNVTMTKQFFNGVQIGACI